MISLQPRACWPAAGPASLSRTVVAGCRAHLITPMARKGRPADLNVRDGVPTPFCAISPSRIPPMRTDRGYGADKLSGRMTGMFAEPVSHHQTPVHFTQQGANLKRFGDVAVEALAHDMLLLCREGAGSHGDDREVSAGGPLPLPDGERSPRYRP